MRRALLLAVCVSLFAAAPAAATHDGGLDLLAHSCGDSPGSVAESSASSANFRTYGSGAISAAQANTVLEEVRARLVGDFGWAAPPEDPDLGLYFARFGNSAAGGVQTSGTYTGTVEGDADRKITCIVLPNTMSADQLREFVANHFSKAIWHGMGSLSGDSAPAFWLREAAAELMEDEVRPADPPDQLPAAWDQPLASYPVASSWFVLRGLTERFGTGQPGGPEDVIEVAFERMAAGTDTDVPALAAALAAKGVTLNAAFHDYAIAARFLAPCTGGYAATPCFADAAQYGAAGPRDPHDTVANGETSYDGEVPGGLTLRWIELPAGPHDVTFANTGGGTVTGTIACDTGSALKLYRLGALGPGTSTLTRNVTCASPTLVVTSDAGADARTFRVSFTAPTTVLEVVRYGEGVLASLPAGIDCGTDCQEVFALGTDVLLGAIPGAGNRFTGWAGDCTGIGACQLKMDADRVVAAGFEAFGIPSGPNAPPGSGPPGDDSTAPRMLISKPRFAKRYRSIRVGLTCPADEASSCTAPVSLVLKVARKRYRLDGEAIAGVKPGRSARVSWKLPSSARSRLRRSRRAAVTVAASARDESFNRLVTRRSFKLKLRRR